MCFLISMLMLPTTFDYEPTTLLVYQNGSSSRSTQQMVSSMFLTGCSVLELLLCCVLVVVGYCFVYGLLLDSHWVTSTINPNLYQANVFFKDPSLVLVIYNHFHVNRKIIIYLTIPVKHTVFSLQTEFVFRYQIVKGA